MVFTCTPLRHQTRTPCLRRCWPWGNTSFREMKDAGFCPANTYHTKLHLYHTVVEVGPMNTGSMAAPKPPIVGQSIAHTSVDNNQKHPRASSASWNQSLGGVDNQPRDTKRWLMRRLMLWCVAGQQWIIFTKVPCRCSCSCLLKQSRREHGVSFTPCEPSVSAGIHIFTVQPPTLLLTCQLSKSLATKLRF